MASIMNLFKVVLIIQLFYAFGITVLYEALPAGTLNYADEYKEATTDLDLEDVSSEIQDSIQKQTDIPVIELGALVFYSGNIIVDLLLNFAFAIPEMLSLLIYGLTQIFNLDYMLIYWVQVFTFVAIVATYFISLIQLLASIRSGRTIT